MLGLAVVAEILVQRGRFLPYGEREALRERIVGRNAMGNGLRTREQYVALNFFDHLDFLV